MIKSIRISNFFGFRESCTIDFEKGENVLVGINGSGKSNLFKAIQLLKEGITGIGYENQINEWGGIADILHRGIEGRQPTEIEIIFDIKAFTTIQKTLSAARVGSLSYTLRIVDNFEPSYEDFYIEEDLDFIIDGRKLPLVIYATGEGSFRKSQAIPTNSIEFEPMVSYHDLNARNSILKAISEPSIYPVQYEFVRTISKILVYNYFDVSQKGKLRERYQFIPAKFLNENGENLTSVLQYIKETNTHVFSKIVDSIKSVNENFTGISALEDYDGKLTLRLTESNLETPISNLQISDGTLRFLCLMTILYNPNRGSVICIDEPELGLHPDMLLNLKRAIEFAAQSSQIILATHSSLLLNLFEIENIIVFEKSTTNGTVSNKFSSDQFEKWKGEFLPGDLWNNGHLGGTRW